MTAQPVIIREPIFVDGDGGIDVFLTVAAAQRYIEPADVDDCIVYDATGQLLSLERNDPTSRIAARPDARSVPDELAQKLRQFLMHCRHLENDLAVANLNKLVEISTRYRTI